MPRSAEPIRRHIKANNPTDTSSFGNSNSCSSRTLTVPIFTVSKYSRVSREAKFQYTGSVIRESQNQNSVVDRKVDVSKGKSIIFPPSQTSNVFLQG